MIHLSTEAAEAIRRIQVQRDAPKGVGVKLIKGTRGELALLLAAPRPGDLVVPSEEDPLLVVDGEIASEYRGCTLDLQAKSGGDGAPAFVLRDPLHDA
jgi:hypothetical protein